MATHMISVRKFRENMPSILKEAQKKNIHYIVMRHSTPIARVEPIREDPELEALIAQVERGMKEYRTGKYYTMEEVRKELDLKKSSGR